MLFVPPFWQHAVINLGEVLALVGEWCPSGAISGICGAIKICETAIQEAVDVEDLARILRQEAGVEEACEKTRGFREYMGWTKR